jgi:hypothetical protein
MYVAEGDALDWGCDVVWTGEEITDEESRRHRENCVAVVGTIYRVSDEEDVPTEELFLKMAETANIHVDEAGEV